MFNRRDRRAALAALCICATFGWVRANAQAVEGAPPGPLTLEQVLELAEMRSESIAISRAGVERAEGEKIRARSGKYPQLNASAGYDRAITSEFQGLFDGSDFGGDAEGSDGFEDLPFGRANTWRVSLALSQNIFDSGRLRAQAGIADAGRDAAQLGVSTARGQLLFDVTQAYYDAALSDRLVRIAEATLEQAGATLQQTQAGFDAGTQPEFELIRARVTRDSQLPVVIRQRANREVALLRLKQMLDLPPDFNLEIVDALGDERLAPPVGFAVQVAAFEKSLPALGQGLASVVAPPEVALLDRTAVRESAATVRLRESTLELAEAQKKPSVSLNSTYTRLGYPTTGVPTFDRSNWSVGASVNLPILTGGRQRGDEQVAKAELEQAKLQLRQTQELAALDMRSAWAELLAARAAWEASTGTVQQAARAHEIADVRFRAGVSTQLELSDARLQLQQAEANRSLAARDLQVARARLALLPDLPVGTTTTPRAPVSQPQPPAAPSQAPAGGSLVTNVPGQPSGFQVVGSR